MSAERETLDRRLSAGRLFGRLWPIWLALLCLSAALPASAARPAADGSPYVETQLIVRLENEFSDTIDQLNADYGTTTIDIIEAAAPIYLLQVAPGDDSDVIAGIMDPSGSGGDPRVDYAEANYLSDLPEGNPQGDWAWGGDDPAPIGTQYAADLVNLHESRALGQQGAGVLVAVVDTGFQLDHPWLVDNWSAAAADVLDDDGVPLDEQNGVDDDGDAQVDEAYGHGTHVAGIVRQVAPRATLLPIRALDSDGRSTLWHIGEAIDFALDQGARVINFSLGTDYESEMFFDLAAQAAAADVVLVGAAGNMDTTALQYPAALPGAIGVTAIDESLVRAPFANYGWWVDMAAPGVSVFSSYPTDGYAWWSGTSMATPFVAGAAAVLLGIDGALAPAQVESLLTSTAIPIDAQNPGFGGQLGAGSVDVWAAVQSIVPAGDVLYLTLDAADTVDGMAVGAGDILGFHTGTESWFMPWSAVDYGLGSADIDAFMRYGADRLVVSFTAPLTVPGVGLVAPADLLLVNPATGAAELAFDGSDVGLASADENVDAVAIVDGRLAISTSGPFQVPGLSGQDEDLIALNDAVFGENTAGTWSLLFDGSASGLGGDAARDVAGAWSPAPDTFYLTPTASFTLAGQTFDGRDVARCVLDTATQPARCDAALSGLYFDGDAFGLSAGIDGLDVWPDAP